MNDRRILGIRDGKAVPLFGPAFAGPPSPSPTLPVETVVLPPSNSASHIIPEQMITLFLQPAIALHSEKGGPTQRLAIPAKSLAFSLRAREESVLWETGAKFMSLTIDDGVLARATEEICRGGRFELMRSPNVRDEQLSSLLHSLYQENKGGHAAGRLYIDGIEQSLAALLASRYNALSGSLNHAPATLPPVSANRLVEYMHAHMAEQLTLAELAVHTGYSESHFSRLFKGTFGMPAHHYLMSLRVEKARQLLLSNEPYSILDIALTTGFANAQHFSRIFFRFTGMTPSAFRRTSR